MKKIALCVATVAMVLSLGGNVALAHIANEKTLYDDIESSKANEQIVILNGIGLLPAVEDTRMYRPQAKLTKYDLKKYADAFMELCLPDYPGHATYGDVNRSFFRGKASAEKADQEITREEFALYVGQYLTEKVNQKTLFEIAHFEPGPSGTVEKVASRDEGQGEGAFKVYTLTIGGKNYPVAPHANAIYSPTDLAMMVGKNLASSWQKAGELQILVAEKGQSFDALSATASAQYQVDQEQASDFPVVPVVAGGGGVLVALLAWLFLAKKKRDKQQ